MPQKPLRQDIFKDLRRRAEQIVGQQRKKDTHMDSEELLRLLHEIEVYQVEVELQNEELRHTSHELQASRDAYFDLFNFAPVGFMVLDCKGRIKRFNNAVLDLLDVDPAWLKGSNFFQYIHASDKHKFLSWFRQMADQSDVNNSIDLRILGKEKRMFHVHLDAKAVLDKASNVQEWRLALTDVTNRKQAESALREKSRLLQNIIDTTSDLISITDMEGNFTFISPSHGILGYNPDSLLGRNALELIHPDDYQEIANAFEDFLANREDWKKVEYRYRRADGNYLWFETVAKFILDDAGNPKEILFSTRDFTERKQADEKILYLQKSESLGRMAGAIAHHFNNQIYVVIGNLELVLDDLPEGTENRENLFQAIEAAQKAADQSRQMQHYLGYVSEKKTTIDLSDVCRQSLTFLQTAAPSEITLKFDSPDFGPFVNADAVQIQQVLTNLFTNSHESMHDNEGTIGLIIQIVSHEDIPTSRRFPLDWEPQDITYACLEISDTGCGISNEDIEKIFDPYFSTKFTGRGMGLSVIIGIMKTHSGCITVDSTPGCGSVFRVYLPLASEKQNHKKPTSL